MDIIPDDIHKLTGFFQKLPGVGSRQASRLSFFVAHYSQKNLKDLAKLIWNISQDIKICSNCFFLFAPNTKNQILCPICQDPNRNHNVICVVENDTDLITIEKIGKYKGEYHILGGLLSNIDEAKENSLTIKQLIFKVRESIQNKKPIEEIILALNPTAEGYLTSLYLKKILEPYNIKITQIGVGIPYGGEIEFADPETIKEAIKRRH